VEREKIELALDENYQPLNDIWLVSAHGDGAEVGGI
jgi:hypothetical protein